MTWKKNEKIRKLVIFTIIITLCLTAIQINAQPSTDLSLKHNKSKNFNIDHMKLNKESIKIRQLIEDSRSISTNLNIPILTSGEFDIQKPSMATNGNEILVIAEEKQGLFLSDVIITYSSYKV